MSFNPTQGISLAESSANRALLALPLLAVGFLCSCRPKQSLVDMMVQSGHGRISSAEDGSDSSSLDGGTLVDSYQVVWFFVDVAPMYLIWVMEANRRANHLKPIQLTLIFGLLAQTNSLDLWANLWFFLHYIQSPIESFAAADQRLLNMGYARALLPTVLLSYAVPVLAMLFSPGRTVAEHLRPVQHFFPVLPSIVHNLFARATQDTTKLDRIYNVTADLSSLRRAGRVAGIVSAATLQYLRYQNSTFGRLSNAIPARTLDPPAFSALLARIAHHVHVAPYAGAALWVALLFKDLKTAGMVKTSWMWLLLYAAISTTIIGPGATLIAAWAWREEVLASKRHWAAVIKAG